jgi:UPF0716 protein FxsA
VVSASGGPHVQLVGTEVRPLHETPDLIIFLLIFVGLPVFELYLLIQVGSRIGALPTIGLTILTAVIGGVLVRLQGLSVLGRVRASLDRGDVPALEMLDGALLLIAGFLLLLPGFVTDAIGFLLLVPVVRRLVIARYVQVIPRHSPSGADEGPRVIEGEFRRDD